MPGQASLNSFLALGRPARPAARAALQRLLADTEGGLRDNAALRREAIIPMARTARPCLLEAPRATPLKDFELQSRVTAPHLELIT